MGRGSSGPQVMTVGCDSGRERYVNVTNKDSVSFAYQHLIVINMYAYMYFSYFAACYDEIIAYQRPLSDAEVLALYTGEI